LIRELLGNNVGNPTTRNHKTGVRLAIVRFSMVWLEALGKDQKALPSRFIEDRANRVEMLWGQACNSAILIRAAAADRLD